MHVGVDSGAVAKQGNRLRVTAVLVLVCGAQFMVVLDISVVNVALPAIRSAFGVSEVALGWVVNAYALVFAGLLLLGGRLADLYGRKRMFLAGLGLFTAASLAGGLAASAGWLIAARAGQGLGAALLAPVTLTILTTTFSEGPARTRALALWAAVGMAGGTAGNLISGLLVEIWSWRAILLINVPVGIVVAAAAWRLIDRDGPGRERPRLDVPGAVLATAGLAAVAYGAGQAGSAGWSSAVPVLAAGAVLLAAFVIFEVRWASAPLLPLRLWRIRSVVAGNAALLLAGACLNPMWFFLTLSMQNGLGYSPLQTGIAFLPHTLVTLVIGVWLTPRLMRYVDWRALISGGAILAAAGFAWQGQLSTDSDYLSGILGPAVLFSIGGGLLNTPITAAVTAGVDSGDAGAASGLMNTTKQVGAALGLAVLIVLGMPATEDANSPDGLLAGYDRAFLAIAGVMVAVAAIALLLPSRKDNVHIGR
ncbi:MULTISPECIES: MFS transporter [Nocardia]|uniref:MFS transporter n=1 Tax=Nocardia TaxID=1817 RepID=UPI001893ADC9|nr:MULTISPECIES: MFS transporter [Nocardia]MBF6352057.1 MFS transporter [Nocardia flavorosea]